MHESFNASQNDIAFVSLNITIQLKNMTIESAFSPPRNENDWQTNVSGIHPSELTKNIEISKFINLYYRLKKYLTLMANKLFSFISIFPNGQFP